MTESEWLECSKPTPMLEFVLSTASTRKLRLFACACCRAIWDALSDNNLRSDVERAERIADDLAAEQQRVLPKTLQMGAYILSPTQCAGSAVRWAVESPLRMQEARNGAALVVESVSVRRRWQITVNQSRYIRDIFANPFRSVSIHDAWLTPTVTTLAQAAYDNRTLPSGELDPARLAVLADALMDAGCDSADILSHLREPGPHVRGCWVVDLLLGKE